MKKNRNLFAFVLLFGLLSVNTFSVRAQTIRVAVAANAQFVMQDIKKAFEQKGQVKIELIVSSSGKLTAQITHGAPYDIFLSADMKYPKLLYDEGYTLNKPQVYAYGSLVLWTLKNISLKKLNILSSPTIKTIAVANPETAPYGMAAIQALKKAGIYEQIKHKIVYGESIAQVNQYLLSGVADVAFTAKSVVDAPNLRHKGQWTEPPGNTYEPIMQGAVILKHAQENDLKAVKEFYQFLSGKEGKAIFTSYGYIVK